jgi:AAA family ATP:ADP antiporter
MMAPIMSAATDQARPSLFDRVFGLERHEYAAVAWSFLYFFCVLSAYYILRPVREMLGVQSGPDTLPYLFTASFVVMLIATPIFGWITSRYPRKVFLPWVYAFFILNILVFWAVSVYLVDEEQSHVWLGRIFFVWLSVFNLYVVSVFWSFMADIYTREQGRRLFGLLSSGGSIGALLGSTTSFALAQTVGSQNLFPISAVLLTLAILCIRQLRQWVMQDEHQLPGHRIEMGASLGGNALAGATHANSSNYFRAIVAASVIASLLGTALYLFRAYLVQESILDQDAQTQFFAAINLAQNFVTILGQMFLVRYVVRRLGLGAALSVMPVLSVLCFVWVAADPSLLVIAIVDVIRRASGFTFSKPSTDMLYSVVTPEEKYKTKNFIDTTVYRFGDVIGIFLIRSMLTLGYSAVSLIMVPFAIAWIWVATWLGKDYRRRARELRKKGLT